MIGKATEKTSLEITRFINPSPSRVYQAWTDPAELQRWFGPEDVRTIRINADVRVGGKYRWDLITADGEEMSCLGEYRELVPERKVVFTWKWDDDDDWKGFDSIVTIDLADYNGGTQLTLRHERLPSEASRDRHGEGWGKVIDRLEKFLQT